MVSIESILFKYVSRSKVKLLLARLIYVFLRIAFRSDRRVIVRGGIRYEVDLSEGLDLSLFLFGSFQERVANSTLFDLPDDAVVIDVGANAGVTALRYAKRLKKGRIYAFEPTDSGYSRLERNLHLNPDLAERVVPIQSFVSHEISDEPDITAYASWDLKLRPSAMRHPVHRGVRGTAVAVGATTLDAFCRERALERIDLIKVDTDGQEFSVLRGAREVIARHRPVVIYEVGLYLLREQGVLFEWFDDYFASLTYRMVSARNGHAVSRETFAREIPAQATVDVVAIPDRVETADRTAVQVAMRRTRTRVAVIGGGIAGLVAAYTMAKRSDAEIVLIEREARLGGLAGSFPIESGEVLEKYYHFICKPDKTYLRLMGELGIYGRLRWKTTGMGLFYNGTLTTLGDPVSLFRFEPLGLGDKIRFAMVSAKTKLSKPDGWKKIADLNAKEWLIEQYGERTYNLLYEPLMRLKFRDYADRISAAWVWARHFRLVKSRTITQKERTGYLDGGSQLFIDRLEQELKCRGVSIHVGVPVERIYAEDGSVSGLRFGDRDLACDYLVSTIPTPYLLPLVADFEGSYWENLRALENIGVVVVLFRLQHPISGYFWMNVSDPRIDFAGIIEYTNLNPCRYLGGDSIVYIPQYVAEDHRLFKASAEELLEEYCGYLRLINPDFDPSWIKQHWVYRDRFSQPICHVGFVDEIPAMQTPIDRMYLTDSHQLHPHDRAISASADLGEKAAGQVLKSIRTARRAVSIAETSP